MRSLVILLVSMFASSCTSKSSDLEIFYAEQDQLAEAIPEIVPSTYPLTCSEPVSGHDPVQSR